MWQPTYPVVIAMIILGFGIIFFSLNRQKKILDSASTVDEYNKYKMVDRWWMGVMFGFFILVLGIGGSFGLAGQSDQDRLDAQCKPRGMEGVQRGMFSRGLCRDPKTGQLYQFEDVR